MASVPAREQSIGYPVRIALRTGFNDADLTVGVGLALGYTDIDYAFTSANLENSHQVSLQLKF